MVTVRKRKEGDKKRQNEITIEKEQTYKMYYDEEDEEASSISFALLQAAAGLWEDTKNKQTGQVKCHIWHGFIICHKHSKGGEEARDREKDEPR